jgi:DNA-binding response OmpR family regulator
LEAIVGIGNSAGRVLVVEDDFQTARQAVDALQRDRFEARRCGTVLRALHEFRSWQPAMIVLDRHLPDGDGHDVIGSIRRMSDVPIVLISRRDDPRERAAALDLGADDCLTIPFGPHELLSRIRAVLRRCRPSDVRRTVAHRLDHGEITLDLEQQRGFLSGADLDLTTKEFGVLQMLMERPGRLVRRSEVALGVWGVTAAEAGKTIDVHLSWLRNKLGDDSRSPRHIATVRGVGFRLLEPAGDCAAS